MKMTQVIKQQYKPQLQKFRKVAELRRNLEIRENHFKNEA